MDIKTIHIKNYFQPLPDNKIYNHDIDRMRALIKELYGLILKDDPKFHFFFEPELIIRITTTECLAKVKQFLQSRSIEFEEYEYPFPPEGKFGEGRDSIVARNLELFLTIFHANSVAAITMNEEEHFQYIERLVHTAFNPKFSSHEQEGTWLANLAALKLGKDGVLKTLGS
ncbi:MAG: hypothetical protein UT08_C0009G0021 [Candidatus Woesebacteria bacterium GW2011_GWB1_38_8]|uniref:Uncharacterized protein n=1 Tax=Candidatus Woesebacteria bacterium GW2011_GWB1_38_8 TaxID=1618570 RepID=A0A0G0L2G4_9BACT|nr:MAG: hypothetical protein UT08_C0009G0021 [Candidatus Woesebacteria bacterium GW2011_GWB1_38_8]